MSKSPEEHPAKAFGWAARDQSGHLFPFNFSRRWSFFIFIFQGKDMIIITRSWKAESFKIVGHFKIIIKRPPPVDINN
jgi:hypothetical protein